MTTQVPNDHQVASASTPAVGHNLATPVCADSAAAPDTAPDIAPAASSRSDGETAFESLHPHARIGMRVGTALMLVLAYSPPTAILLTAWDSAGLSVASKLAMFLLGLLALAASGWRLGGLRYSRTRYALDDAGLRIRRGVWWQSETLVPRSRVQHTDINRGPLDRRFGLATLKVYTAGSKLASVALDGLPEARALQLRDALVSFDADTV